MGVNIQTIKDIRFFLARELEETYQKQEINALANIIIETVIGVTKLHGLYMTEQPIKREQAAKIIDI
ncbi:MAG: hypothetical protein Q7J06_04320, partial [Bacteroidales bacterium]|nr:hypothetical protein [Bacteroidales bacterium]